MAVTTLGVGEAAVTCSSGDVLKIIGLGSCIAVVALDPVPRQVGLLHVALPDSRLSPELVARDPGRFADTGVPWLLERMGEGGRVPVERLVIKLVGGASIMDPERRFDIGRRNLLAIRRALWRLGLGPVREEVGGIITRTVQVEVDTGRVLVSTPDRRSWEI